MTNEIDALYSEIVKEATFWTAKQYAEEISKTLNVEISKSQLEELVKQNWDKIEERIVELAVYGYNNLQS